MTPYIRVDYVTEETILRGTEVLLELWNGTPNTKVHWVSQTENIDWTTSITDNSGYTYAFYKVDKPEGTYKIYAWDEVARVATNVVTIKVTELALNLTDLQIVPSTDSMNPASAGWFIGTVYGNGSGRFKISVDGTYYPADYPFPDPIHTQTQFYEKLTSGSHNICINTIAMSDEICRTVSFTPPTYSFTLNASKTSVVKGDSVTFTGTYKSSAKVVIYDVYYGKITETTCNDLGYFMVSANLNVPEGSRQFQALSTDLLPKESNIVYITVTTPTTATHLICKNNICTKVSGTGTNECTSEGSTCVITIVTKELVTNLTSDENLIKAVIVMTETPGKYTYVRKYQEGDDWVFVFNCNTEFNYVEFGAGAGLAKFIGANWTSIAWLLATAGIITIVWMWRDVSTKAIELEGKLSDDTTNRIKLITDNTELTPEEKAKLISEVLGAYRESKPGTGLCGLLGLDDQVCTDLKYVGIGLGALIIGYTVYKILPKRK